MGVLALDGGARRHDGLAELLATEEAVETPVFARGAEAVVTQRLEREGREQAVEGSADRLVEVRRRVLGLLHASWLPRTAEPVRSSAGTRDDQGEC